MKKLRWGVLSTANIGLEKVIPAMQQGEYCEMAAIASQSLEKGQAAAAQLGIPKACGSYDELLADAEIDAVYIPLPNHLHVPWAIKALKAGKHVLCEKPIGLTTAEAKELLVEARKHPELKVMEAFMYRHHPQWQRALQLVNEGKIGALQTIHSFFSYYNADPENIRNMAQIGGGGLMDIGATAFRWHDSSSAVNLKKFWESWNMILNSEPTDFVPGFSTLVKVPHPSPVPPS